MNSPAAFSPLHQALSLSRRMLQAAKDHHWSDVATLEVQRRKLLDQAFVQEENLLDERSAALVREIIDYDNQLITLTRNLQNDIGAQLSEIQQGRKGTKAYQNTRRVR